MQHWPPLLVADGQCLRVSRQAWEAFVLLGPAGNPASWFRSTRLVL